MGCECSRRAPDPSPSQAQDDLNICGRVTKHLNYKIGNKGIPKSAAGGGTFRPPGGHRLDSEGFQSSSIADHQRRTFQTDKFFLLKIA